MTFRVRQETPTASPRDGAVVTAPLRGRPPDVEMGGAATSRPAAPAPAHPALAAGAAVSLAFALGVSSGFLNPAALALATLATGLAVAAVALGRRVGQPAEPDLRSTIWILAVGVAVSLAWDARLRPGALVPRDTARAIRPLLAGVAVAAASLAWRRAPSLVVRLRFPVLLGLAATMAAIVIVRSPAPRIDVWYVQELGARALLDGVNPYAVLYPNIYGPATTFYSPEVLTPDRLAVIGLPYPPLPILLAAPAVLAGIDVRWSTLALVLFSAWGIRRLGRGSTVAELAAVLLLVQPRALFVLEQSWTEPAVLAAMVAVLLAVDGWRRAAESERLGSRIGAAGIAAGVAMASKQYAALLLLPLLFTTPPRGRWRAAVAAVATAAALVGPFLLWDPVAFYRGVVAFQIVQPFRPDALSWLAAAVSLGGPVLPVWPAFLLGAGVLAVGTRRELSLAQAVLTGAAAWLTLVVLNKQAFCNYYWLAVGLLCAATALGSAAARGAVGVTRRPARRTVERERGPAAA